MKTNHKLSALQILLAALCGVVLAVFRARTGGAGRSFLLVCCAAAVVLLLAARRLYTLRNALSLKPLETDKFAFALLTLSGLLFIGAGALFFLLRGTTATSSILLCAFSVFSGLVTLARLSLRDRGQVAAVYSLVPVFFLNLYVLLLYRSNGGNPYLSVFGCELAVVMLALLGLYAAAAGRFEKARPRLLGFLCSLSGCLITQELLYLALDLEQLHRIAGFSAASALLLCACGVLMCHALIYPPVREVFPAEKPKDTPEESTEA